MIEAQLNKKAQELVTLCYEHKVLKAVPESDPKTFVPFKMVLQPMALSPEQYAKLLQISQLWQKLTYLASFDIKQILTVYKECSCDALICPLVQILEESFNSRIKCRDLCTNVLQVKPQFILSRFDYFLTSDSIKLIEYNLSSVSMAAISNCYQTVQQQIWSDNATKNLPENNSLKTYASALSDFYKEHSLEGVMLMVTQSNETNLMDQAILKEAILKLKVIPQIIDVPIGELEDSTRLAENGDLFYKDTVKIAIVYYRAGYSIKQAQFSQCKKKTNLSNAVNIPSVAVELVNHKRMQAMLSQKQTLLKYLNEQEAQILMSSVIETWGFCSEKEFCLKEVLSMMQRQGIENFVLKPNAEGGLNNFFGVAAYNKLKELKPEERSNYVLTRKIHPVRQVSNIVVLNKQQIEIQQCEIDSEFSIYGSIYSYARPNYHKQEYKHTCDGFLIRSKPSTVNEGGLMSGTGAISGLEIIEQL